MPDRDAVIALLLAVGVRCPNPECLRRWTWDDVDEFDDLRLTWLCQGCGARASWKVLASAADIEADRGDAAYHRAVEAQVKESDDA